MSETSEPPPATDHVPVATKIAYGLGSGNDMWGNWLYAGLVWTVFNMYLGVPPELISLALTFRLLFDAITDPLFGWLSDNTRSRFGRRRPYILVGSILSGLCLPLLFTVGHDWTDNQYFWYILGSSVIYMTFVSCFNMPYQSLGPEITPDYDERTQVFSYKAGIQKIFEVGNFAAGAFATAAVWLAAKPNDAFSRLGQMIDDFTAWLPKMIGSVLAFDFDQIARYASTPFGWVSSTGDELPNVVLGAQVYTSILGLIMILIGCAVFLGVKERNYERFIKDNKEKISLSDTFNTLRCPPFRPQMIMALVYSVGTSMLGTLGLYLTNYYVCKGNITEGSLWNFGMGLAGMGFGFLAAPTFAKISKIAGKTKAMMIVQVCAIAVFVGTWWFYDPNIKWLQFFASGLISFTATGFWLILSSIGADVIDYDEWQNGKRREGAFSACTSLILKFGMIGTTAATGYILTWIGFDADLGGDQSDSTIFWIRFLFLAVPIVSLIGALVALSFFPLTHRKMNEIRSALEARRGAV
ncbi:MAG: MFS transporter [Verrucomicrobiota bacterium]